MARPHYVRASAWELFHPQVPDLDGSTEALVRAAVAVARHEHKTADPNAVLAEIARLAETVRERARSGRRQAVLAHLHHLLFDELEFSGEDRRYYDPQNSYLPQVLTTRRGIPISLALVYKAVGEGAGLEVCGINAPGHFLAAVREPDRLMLVDAYGRGRVLSKEDAFRKIDEATGHPVPRSDEFLPVATHRQWIARMLLNLKNVFLKMGRLADVRAMGELEDLL